MSFIFCRDDFHPEGIFLLLEAPKPLAKEGYIGVFNICNAQTSVAFWSGNRGPSNQVVQLDSFLFFQRKFLQHFSIVLPTPFGALKIDSWYVGRLDRDA